MAETARPFNSEAVCRTITRSTWISKVDGSLDPGAFLLKPDDVGLSVNYEPGCGEAYLSERFGCYGAAHLDIVDIEALELHVVPDELVDNIFHALIMGLPAAVSDMEQIGEAERIAGVLARMARLVTWPRAKKPK